MSKIITFPHFGLKEISQSINKIDKHLKRLLFDLEHTLTQKDLGIGLAAPQINIYKRVFATFLPLSHNQSPTFRYFINPLILAHSDNLILKSNPKNKDDDLEGCLSVPNIYAPVYRYEWLELAYQTIENHQLISHQEKFSGFAARVIQHEFDHLDGILFIDRVLTQKTPIFLQNKNQKLAEITPKELFEIFGEF